MTSERNWATPAQLARLRAAADAPPPRRLRHPERAFTDAVKRYAIRGGWLAYHTLHAKGSDPGFPDLILLRACRLVAAELKAPAAGRPQAESEPTAWQRCWLTAFGTLGLLAGPHLSIETYVWLPSDWPDVERILE